MGATEQQPDQTDQTDQTVIEQKSRGPVMGFINLFFQWKFGLHRMVGLSYLIQYAIVTFLFFYDYAAFLRSPLIITLPITGVIQTIVAIYTFTFLPKTQVNPGYYNDKTTMSYPFIKENLFFTGLLCFQWLYYNDRLYQPFWKVFFPLEYLFVFLPYVFRFLFPKTRFRDGIAALKKEKANYSFYYYLTYLTKIFYIWAKHYIGFFLNYLRFINGATAYDQKCVYMLLISACFATTIAMFLHTLRFKRYVQGTTSFGTYVVAYLSTFVGYGLIFHVFFAHPLLFAITLVGLVLNLINLRLFDVYQICVMLSFHFGLVHS